MLKQLSSHLALSRLARCYECVADELDLLVPTERARCESAGWVALVNRYCDYNPALLGISSGLVGVNEAVGCLH